MQVNLGFTLSFERGARVYYLQETGPSQETPCTRLSLIKKGRRGTLSTAHLLILGGKIAIIHLSFIQLINFCTIVLLPIVLRPHKVSVHPNVPVFPLLLKNMISRSKGNLKKKESDQELTKTFRLWQIDILAFVLFCLVCLSQDYVVDD